MKITARYRAGLTLALALALLCMGLAASAASAAEFPYTFDQRLSLTGDCSTTPPADEVVDPDCEPTYPPPPDGPSGRFDKPYGLTVDDWGNTYVASRSGDGTEGRIDVFDSEGHFITEIDAPFGPQNLAIDGEGNLYAFESLVGVPGPPASIVRYPPTAYEPAAGNISYDPSDRVVIGSATIYNGLAIDRQDPADASDDRLYVADDDRIRIYSPAAEGNALLDAVEPPGLKWSVFVAVDSERRLLYTTHCKDGSAKCVVWVLDADAPYTFVKEISGAETPQGKFFSGQGWISLAVDETNGHLFIGDLAARKRVFELKDDEEDGSYEFVSAFDVPKAPFTSPVQSDVAENPKAPDPLDEKPKDNYRHFYVPLPFSSGAAFAFSPPETGPPVIKDAAARNIGETEAEIAAVIEPKQLATTYTVEYVPESQFQIDGFASATVAKTGALPAVKPPQSISALVSGLTPGESYRFRIFAENGLGSDEEVATFATFEADPFPACPNDELRVGPSAALPDCRAYELVTPPGARGPIGASFEGERFGMVQASPDGNRMSFELNAGALPGTEASGYFHGDPYLATRSATGWSTKLAGATGTMSSKPKPGSFAPDQDFSFFTAAGAGTAVIGSRPTTYVRYPDGRYELIGRGSIGTDPRALGRLIAPGGTHVVFETENFDAGSIAQQLEPNAPPEGTGAVYDRTRDPLTGVEETHVVSLLPGEITPAPGQHATFAGASPEGDGIAFTIAGSLYLRVRNEATHLIGAGAKFAGLAEGGERIFYLSGGDLKAYDAATAQTTVFADTAAEVIPVNVAPRGTRAYFVSETALGEPNPHGQSAVPGAQNLYLAEEDEGVVETVFIATVTELDVEGLKNEGAGLRGHGLGLWIEALEERKPALVSSRLTPDGETFVFQSRANLDGYQPGAEPQIYRYERLEETLECVSCPPTEAAASGGAYLQSLFIVENSAFGGASAFVPALRADGERLFFESTEALVNADVDGRRDVYEWEEAGIGSCQKPGGCLYLLSAPGSAKDEYLFGHSSSGDDVFIHTSDVLVPGAAPTIAIYDARVNGGFASTPDEICVGEGCRPDLTPPPALTTPPSSAVGPSGNAKSTKPARKCPKGKRKVKRKGKVVCIKKKGKKHRKASNRGARR
jgi:hypothetical protein